MSEDVDLELDAVLEKLDLDRRKQVLKYARSLEDHRPPPKRSMLDLVGTISREDLQIMRETIEEMRINSCSCVNCSRLRDRKRAHPGS
ncbi:MAG TPA: hypothetical protein VLK84_13620 [Longimicrobium sp.]|nr:hypothetical protein [Longimicrobium sp.]